MALGISRMHTHKHVLTHNERSQTVSEPTEGLIPAAAASRGVKGGDFI